MIRNTWMPCCTLLLLFAVSLFFASGCGPGGDQLKTKVAIDKPVPEFILTDIKGQVWKLSDLRGKVIFINFWATWCAPCLEEMPSMEVLNQTLPKESFQMLTILYNDRPEFAFNMAKKINFTAPIIVESSSEMALQYGLTGVPETFIIDTEGILRQKFIGPQEWDSPEAMAMLKKYLPAPLP